MIDFKCTACKDYTEIIDVISLGKDPQTGKKHYLESRACYKCNLLFEIEENIISSIMYNCKIKEKEYHWKFYYKKEKSKIFGPDYSLIHEFNFIPNDITPQNIKEKLSKYLLLL